MQNQTSYARKAGIAARDYGEILFLIDDSKGAIHAIEGAEAGIWRVLETPMADHDLASIFHAAFPDQKPKTVRQIVKNALQKLVMNKVLTAT